MLNTSGLDNLVPALEKKLSVVVRKTAFDAQAIYQQSCARDTGAMANSAYVASEGNSGYEAAKGQVSAANSKAELFDEIQPSEVGEVPAAVSAILAVMVYYAFFVEFGTRRQPAQPAFVPAVSAVEANFIKGCSQAAKEAATGGMIQRSQL